MALANDLPLVAVVDAGIERIPLLENYVDRAQSFDYVEKTKSQEIDYSLKQSGVAHGTFIAYKIVRPHGNQPKIKVMDLVYESYSSRVDTHSLMFPESSLQLYQRKEWFRKETIRFTTIFNDAVRSGAKVINFSSGSAFFHREEFEKWVKEVAEPKNIYLVVSSGNSGESLDSRPQYPCSVESKHVICVGSIDKNKKRSSFSNYGQAVDFYARGDHGPYQGTSYAVPDVAREAALILHQTPELSAGSLYKRLSLKFPKNP